VPAREDLAVRIDGLSGHTLMVGANTSYDVPAVLISPSISSETDEGVIVAVADLRDAIDFVLGDPIDGRSP
jgi:hypothetical protein